MSTIDRKPPLVAGQRLHRREFHARYEAMPPGIKAELVGGVVFMSSPVGRRHGQATANTIFWLGLFRARTPGLEVLDNASTALDDTGEPQPDALLRVAPEFGGQTSNEGNLIAGAPELVVEVADTSLAVDLGAKLADYERVGVREYVVVGLNPEDIYWFVRRGDRLERITTDPDGLYRSGAFPGLWLDPAALLADDVPALVAAVERGLATPEHAAFVARMTAARRML